MSNRKQKTPERMADYFPVWIKFISDGSFIYVFPSVKRASVVMCKGLCEWMQSNAW